MRIKLIKIVVLIALIFSWIQRLHSQGSFVNLDFEDGTFIPIPGDPFGSVEFGPAMPGWTGYLGTNQVNSIWYNNRSLSDAGIAIMGPTDFLHGEYYIVLANSFPTPSLSAAISQTGTIPADAASIRFYSVSQIVIPLGVTFNGDWIALSLLGTTANNQRIWGGNVSAFAGQTGELRFFGEAYLDNIFFSPEAIPEPSVFGLFALGSLLLGSRLRRKPK